MPKVEKVQRTIMYVNRGGYIMPVNVVHIKLCATLTQRLKARIGLIPHEIAPTATIARSFPAIVKIYEEIGADAKEHSQEVIVGGGNSVNALMK
ncbi:hypothetical protein K437DRAFT_253802 [Tilletiaria anomala UBC 951]|uniref:Uncharacterized protein n=1 Tax=Tilletiaria anomala (strain ATCC 24038 / CBS 436.72 / UBC 951) TaxID=1037660 RepID=A0A066WGH4_TILAU|nr:uncharacterized protein K437DRAFT_253802 [Tilletiaria anomala UBC 951]KDN52861.1 hypothetical protein K437DRAFT_253802 [Tilletiaria anomala UBC 951]